MPHAALQNAVARFAYVGFQTDGTKNLLLDLFLFRKRRGHCHAKTKEDVESFGERLAEVAQRLREQAKALPPGIERDELIRKARQAETASHLNEWLTSPGLQPPK